jgi:hypothetical protein
VLQDRGFAIIVACQHACIELLRLLVEWGGDLSCTSNGLSSVAACLAARVDDDDVLRRLELVKTEVSRLGPMAWRRVIRDTVLFERPYDVVSLARVGERGQRVVQWLHVSRSVPRVACASHCVLPAMGR